MSESDDNKNNQLIETNDFARQFAEFMRSALTQSNSNNSQPPVNTSYNIDTQPLVLGFKLNGENYPLCTVLMKTAISGRGMISHVTGVPSPPSPTDPAFPKWQQADHCVFTWLVQNLESKLAYAIVWREDARSLILRPVVEKSGTERVGAGLAVRSGLPNHSSAQYRGGGNGGGNWNRRGDDRKSEEDKSEMGYTHCGRRKHTKDSCFEIVGFPEWWETKHGKPGPPSSSQQGRRGTERVTLPWLSERKEVSLPKAAGTPPNPEAPTARITHQPEEI